MMEEASSFSMGATLLKEAQRRYPDTDSLFCTNDDLAVGAMFECQRQGLRVPQEMAIAGFHGHDITQVVTPELATVVTPREKMGRESAALLLSSIRGESRDAKQVNVGFTISEGGSI
jgi:LacI family gluconate utilization system Gnt-I transcriptional repressor